MTAQIVRTGVAAGLYFGLLATMWLARDARIAAAALLAVITLAFAPALWRGRRMVWGVWLAGMLLGGWLIAGSHARNLLDLVPVAIGITLCWIFARTLRRGRQPFIARAIIAVDGPARLREPGVAAYARGLTFAWTGFFVILAGTALLVALCVVPDGLLANFDMQSPLVISRPLVRMLHWTSLAAMLAFFVLEYAYRLWHLRHLEQIPAHTFVTRLIRRWPQLLRDSPMQTGTPHARDWTLSLSVPAGHPALAGHFPGNPVVPGVVLLDHVASAVEKAGFGSIKRFASAKFVSPLRPEAEVALRLQVEDCRVRFTIADGDRTILRGEGDLA